MFSVLFTDVEAWLSEVLRSHKKHKYAALVRVCIANKRTETPGIEHMMIVAGYVAGEELLRLELFIAQVMGPVAVPEEKQALAMKAINYIETTLKQHGIEAGKGIYL